MIADNFCWERSDTSAIELDCTVAERGQPRSIPIRMWLRNGELVYSAPVGEDLDPNLDFFDNNTILSPGIFEPDPLTATRDGKLFYFDNVKNITMPMLLSDTSIRTIEEARSALFDLSLGNWTCVVNSSLGIDSVTYNIRECGKHNVIKFSYRILGNLRGRKPSQIL